MTLDICGDDRFELIEEAKRRLLESTNIEDRPEELAVLDSILFRFWQMGWLDQFREDNDVRTCHNIFKVTDARGRKVRFVCSECDAWIDSEFMWNPEYLNGESPWVHDCKLNYCPNCGRRIEEESE